MNQTWLIIHHRQTKQSLLMKMKPNQLELKMSKSLNIATATAALIAAAAEAGHTLTETKARELVKTNKIASNKRVAEAVEALGKKKTRRIRSERIIEAGPRGFRVDSKAWLDSIRSVEGIAVHPSNLPKLRFHAEQLGVKMTDDQVALAKAVAQHLPV
jgi:hypothetical protein